MNETIQVSPSMRRFNALVATFDLLTLGQHDRYEPEQILEWFIDTDQVTWARQFRQSMRELGYMPFEDTPAIRTETVKETQLFGI